MPAWSSWVLADQTAIDTCAEELHTAGWANDVSRGWDTADPPNAVRYVEIHDPNDPGKPQRPMLGQVVVLMGSMLLVMSQADYEASPFYEAP